MEIDEKLFKKINRHLRAIRIMLGFFTLICLALVATLVFLVYKVVTFTQNVDSKIDTIQQTTTQKLDLKSQLCDGSTANYLTQQLCE